MSNLLLAVGLGVAALSGFKKTNIGMLVGNVKRCSQSNITHFTVIITKAT